MLTQHMQNKALKLKIIGSAILIPTTILIIMSILLFMYAIFNGNSIPFLNKISILITDFYNYIPALHPIWNITPQLQLTHENFFQNNIGFLSLLAFFMLSIILLQWSSGISNRIKRNQIKAEDKIIQDEYMKGFTFNITEMFIRNISVNYPILSNKQVFYPIKNYLIILPTPSKKIAPFIYELNQDKFCRYFLSELKIRG